MTSSSRIEPPGWITAVAPAATAWSRPSAKGKKASEAQAEPLASEWARPAASPASRGADGGDAGRVAAVHLAGADAGGLAVLGVDDGVGLDVLGHGEGEQHVRDLLRRRLALGDDLQVGGGDARGVAALHQEAAGDRAEHLARPRSGSGRPPVSSRRRFFLAAKTAMASSSASGAMTTSVKISMISSGGGARPAGG